MRAWNEQIEDSGVGESSGRMREVSGTGTLDGDSEGDAVVPERGGYSTGLPGQGLNRPVQSSASDAQFIGGTCTICKHPKAIHFVDTDEIGTWAFCSLSTCECFSDEPKEKIAP